jgi:hypothetical protein
MIKISDLVAFSRFCWRRFGVGCIIRPNTTVKGTLGPDAVLKLFEKSVFAGFVERPSATGLLTLR